MKYLVALALVFTLALPVRAESDLLTDICANCEANRVIFYILPQPHTILQFHSEGEKKVSILIKDGRLDVEYLNGTTPTEAAQLFFDYLTNIIVEEKRSEQNN